MKYLNDKHLKILLIFLFGALNIVIIILLIGLLDLVRLSREDLYSVVIAILVTVLLNYAALLVFSDE